MTKRVKAKREKIEGKKYRGLLAQFIIYLVLRSVDLAASIAVLQNAWSDSSDWEDINYTLLNKTNNENRITRSINPWRIAPNSRRFVSGNFNPRNNVHWEFDHPIFAPPMVQKRRRSNSRKNDPRNIDPRKIDPPSFNPRKADPGNMIPRRFNPGKPDTRGKKPQNIKRRSVEYTSTDSGGDTTKQCQEMGLWNKKKMDSNISEYEAILDLTVFFNFVSIAIFLSHLTFWILTLKITFKDGTDYETRVTRLTRNGALSLLTALIRDVPLSCLNVELLALRSGPEGLACVACIFAGKCRQDDYIENSLNLAKSLLYFNYFMMLFNSLWKGVSGFYRLSHFEEFNLYLIRACASVVFALLYSITTFTPAMFMFIYRYFAIPGLDAPFLYDLATRLAVIGATIWVILVLAVLCCPILYAIRLNAD
jgi:hypothetical protein